MTTLNEEKDINSGAGDGGGVYYSDPQAVPQSSGRRGKLFFGYCCDMRRAVIIVNSVYLVYVFTSLAIVCFGSDHIVESLEDDEVIKQWNTYGDLVLGIMIFSAILAASFAGMGVFGALQYSKCLVMTAAIWYCIVGGLSLLQGHLVGVIMAGIFAYPHFVFSQELKNGIMTEETYPNEVHSCCCV